MSGWKDSCSIDFESLDLEMIDLCHFYVFSIIVAVLYKRKPRGALHPLQSVFQSCCPILSSVS